MTPTCCQAPAATVTGTPEGPGGPCAGWGLFSQEQAPLLRELDSWVKPQRNSPERGITGSGLF